MTFHRLFIFLLGIVCGSVAYAEDSIRIHAQTDIDQIRVGDPIVLTVTVECPESARVIFPGDDLDLTPFTILDRRQTAVASGAGRIEETLVLSVSAYEIGQIDIPAMKVECELEDRTRETLQTQPISIRVATILTEQDQQPRAIKDPLNYEASWVYKSLVLGGAAFLLALIIGTVIWLRRRLRAREVQQAQIQPPPRPIGDVAIDELRALRDEDLLGRGLVKQYYVRLTDIFKHYLAGRYAIATLERTTGEIRRDLAESSLSETDRRDVLHLLEQADLVKFARFEPPNHVAFDMFNLVEAYVLRTRESRISLSGPADEISTESSS